MAQWGKTDDAANSVLWATAQVNKTANSVTRAALYGNTTQGAFINNVAIGQFGLDATEIAVSNGSIAQIITTFPGSGYSANATVTVAGNGTANGFANATGRIAVLPVLPGNSYTTGTNPAITVAAPTAVTFNGTTAVTVASDTIAIATANSKFLVGDKVTYVSSTGAAITPLANNASYYIAFSNTTVVTLATTFGGANIDLTVVGSSDTGHSLTGQTATAVVVISGVPRGATHTGWVLRTVGSGGRAGRVTYECLATLNGPTPDGADDTVLKDA
jgi:hypothetical protein